MPGPQWVALQKSSLNLGNLSLLKWAARLPFALEEGTISFPRMLTISGNESLEPRTVGVSLAICAERGWDPEEGSATEHTVHIKQAAHFPASLAGKHHHLSKLWAITCKLFLWQVLGNCKKC